MTNRPKIDPKTSKVFHYFHYPTHVSKCSQNRCQINLKSTQEPSWTPFRLFGANIVKLELFLPQLGANLTPQSGPETPREIILGSKMGV